jgi:hypothetical protein
VSAARINTLRPGLEPNDCAICALACFLDVSYTDALRAAAEHDQEAAYLGLSTEGIELAAEELGTTLQRVRRFDPAKSYGIVVTPDHAAVVRHGWVLDRDQVFPWAEWRKVRKGRVLLLAAVE